jgi:S-adenosylmethionine hydrolase
VLARRAKVGDQSNMGGVLLWSVRGLPAAHRVVVDPGVVTRRSRVVVQR